MLRCVNCKKEFDPEGWDPLGGDCSVVQNTETGEVIAPEKTYPTLDEWLISKE